MQASSSFNITQIIEAKLNSFKSNTTAHPSPTQVCTREFNVGERERGREGASNYFAINTSARLGSSRLS